MVVAKLVFDILYPIFEMGSKSCNPAFQNNIKYYIPESYDVPV